MKRRIKRAIAVKKRRAAPKAKGSGTGRRSAIREILEKELRRLAASEAILECLSGRLDHADLENCKDGSYYADVVDVVRERIVQSIEQLDSANLAC